MRGTNTVDMTLPPPVLLDVLARVERGVYTAGWYARCACGHCHSPAFVYNYEARNAAHIYACMCPLAQRRQTRWRRKTKGLVA